MVFLYVVFFAFRALFILYLGEEYDGNDTFSAFINGARYDGQVIGTLSVIFFIVGVVFARREFCAKVLKTLGFICVIIVCFVNIANIGFYQIFGDVFNANLLGLIFDDRSAIFATALSGQYNLSLKVLGWLALSVFLCYVLSVLFGVIDRIYAPSTTSRLHQNYHSNNKMTFILFGIFALIALFSINGTIGLKGVSLGKEIKPVSDTFLRKASTGALRDLYLVYKGYKKIASSHFSDYISDETPAQSALAFASYKHQLTMRQGLPNSTPEQSQYSATKDFNNTEINLLEILSHRVNNPAYDTSTDSIDGDSASPKIEHIFYIVAESMSEWHFDSEFDELGLNSELKKLIANGAYKADIFLQNAGNTIASLDVQISGLLQTDIPLSLMAGRLKPIKTAPAVILQDLGYNGTFFYGGSGTWQKLDSYVTTQGFGEIFYSTHIIQNAKVKGYPSPYDNSWGAFDHHLFSFVRDKVLTDSRTNPAQKTFSMIMTTSNHPPYDAPVESFGVSIKEIQAFIAHHPEITQKNITPSLLAHIYYQDKVIGKFIREVSSSLPNSLFIITGDHYDREYPKKSTNARITNSIPFIVYAPRLNPKALSNVGSHIDITPTIIELVAPNGYKYPSFGNAMLQNKATIGRDYNEAFGFSVIANERYIYDGYKLEYMGDGVERNGDKDEANEIFTNLKRAKALSWWIINNGYTIPNDKESHTESKGNE